MQEVDKDRFFATVGQLNVHPRPEPHRTYWETPTRELLGESTPGYLGGSPARYWIADRLAAKAPQG